MAGFSGFGDLSSLLPSYASAFTQTTRLLKLHLAAGSGIPDDALLPHRLTGHEAVNEGFRYELEVLSNNAAIELKSLLGVPAQITILADDGSEREIDGIITEVRQEGADGGFAQYRLVIESALVALQHRGTCRIYTETNVVDLSLKILQEHIDTNPVIGAAFHVDNRLQSDYVVRPFWMQFNETDFDYLKRLWAREGISFVLEPARDGLTDHPQHVLILFDDPQNLDANPCESARFHRADGTEQKDAVTEWKARRFLQKGAVSRASWNHTNASLMSAGEATQTEQGTYGNALAETLEDYQYHPPLEDDESGVLDSRTQIRMLALEGQSKHFEGEGSMRTFMAGTWFSLIQHPIHDQDDPQDRKFVITGLDLTAVNNLPADLKAGLSDLLELGASDDKKPEPPYTNRFICVRLGVPILPHEIKPPRPGILCARAVGPEGEEVHVDDLHRIKVRFLFTRPQEHADAGASDTDADSAWVRLAQMWCSQGFGSSFIPRAGDELLIQFMGDDPDKPMAVGCLSNGVKTPTTFSEASVLPTEKTLSGIRSKMIKGLGGNEVVFDDTPHELRARLACDHLASQLNLGYLVNPRRNGSTFPLGEGFELKTEGWGALRANKGMLLTTDESSTDHQENSPLTSQLKASIDISKTLSDASEAHKAEKLEAIKASEDVKKVLEATKHQGTGKKAKKVAAFSEPVLALSSPTGIVSATPSSQAMCIGKDLHATSGKDTNLTVGGKLAMAIKDMWSVFTSNAGMKIIAGKSDISLQAHNGQLNTTADQGMKVLAINGTLEMLAKKGITLATPGAKFQLKDGEINIEGKNCNVFTAMVVLTAPESVNASLPALPKGDPSYNNQEKVDFKFSLQDIPGSKYGVPRQNLPWKIVKVKDEFTQEEDLHALVHAQESWEHVLCEGASQGDGNLGLSDGQKKMLLSETTKNPKQIWILHGLHAFPISRRFWTLESSPENHDRILDGLNHAPNADLSPEPDKEILKEYLKTEYSIKKLDQIKPKVDC
jgi:type VI secretion system secreted protein VgrG